VSTNAGETSKTLRPRQPEEVILGDNLQVTSENSSNCDSFQEVETVPYGVNVGVNGTYNGSLVLNGWYDSNRIASTSWYLVPESVGNASFLTTGSLDVLISLRNATYNAILDPFATESIMFPSTLFPHGMNGYAGICWNASTSSAEQLVISFPEYAEHARLDIPFATEIIKPDAACLDSSSLDDVSQITLGLPFLQAAYMYVDTEGRVYLTAANTLNATSLSMEKFDPNATLTLPAGVTTYSPSPTKKSFAMPRFAPGFAISSFGAGWTRALIGMLVVVIAS